MGHLMHPAPALEPQLLADVADLGFVLKSVAQMDLAFFTENPLIDEYKKLGFEESRISHLVFYPYFTSLK